MHSSHRPTRRDATKQFCYTSDRAVWTGYKAQTSKHSPRSTNYQIENMFSVVSPYSSFYCPRVVGATSTGGFSSVNVVVVDSVEECLLDASCVVANWTTDICSSSFDCCRPAYTLCFKKCHPFLVFAVTCLILKRMLTIFGRNVGKYDFAAYKCLPVL